VTADQATADAIIAALIAALGLSPHSEGGWYAETWHASAPLVLETAAAAEGPARPQLLGPDVTRGERPQAVVPAHHWQAARSTGAFTLVSCVVAPGFSFQGFELAPKGFEIPPARGGREGPVSQNR
jgi:predicted cupin superfamily sugar epimerase